MFTRTQTSAFSKPSACSSASLLELIGLFVWLAIVPCSFAGNIRPANLRCEYLENPLGIDATHPRLSWIVESKDRAQKQTAYQILVASSEVELRKNHGDLWDSGKVASDETVGIVYAGESLRSRQQCFWKVRVWNRDGKVSDYSERALWEMGLLDPKDWQAKWIARTTNIEEKPAPMFRRALRLAGRIQRARLSVCGLGYCEVYLNGRKVGDHLLGPGYTRYDKRVLYVTYDVTPHLQAGTTKTPRPTDMLGVVLGNGWFNVQTKAVWDFHAAPWREAPKLLLSLFVEYTDGRTEVIGSDESWRCSTGPIVFDSIYGGEVFDHRLTDATWSALGEDDLLGKEKAGWTSVKIVGAPKGKLVAQANPPVKADRIVQPVKVTEPKPGIFIFDLGQNFSGNAQLLNVKGPAGTEIKMRYAERLHPDGTLDADDISKHVKRLDASQQFQTDVFILRGGSQPESWHSRFTYHGFQFVEVTGFPGKPTLENLRGMFIHTAVEPIGEFACSNPLFNKILRNARWAYLSNLQGIPTDCPHREKNGWTGDAHLACEQGLFNYDGLTTYEKWLNDLADEQQPTGELPGIVPTSGWGYKWGNGPAWDSAFLLIPFYLYEYCGDARALTNHYEGLKRYVDYLTSRANGGIVNIGLPDWAPWKTKTPPDITSTAYYFRDAQIVFLAATLLEKNDDAKKYLALAADIKRAFNKRFYDPNTGLYGNGGQTSLSCALYQGLVEPENKARVVSNLVAAVERNNWHIDTGILGAKYLLNALAENGRADVALRIANQTDQPGWGWWIQQGATTLWEQWNGSESRNHIMFGDIVAWFYKNIGGINPGTPGFKSFDIKISPPVVKELAWAQTSYDSVRGRIATDWRAERGKFFLKLTVPANTTARVYLPTEAGEEVLEGRRTVSKAEGVSFLRVENGQSVFEVGSGNYEFSFQSN